MHHTKVLMLQTQSQDIVEEVLREQPEIEEKLLRKFAGQAGRDIAKHYRTYLLKMAY